MNLKNMWNNALYERPRSLFTPRDTTQGCWHYACDPAHFAGTVPIDKWDITFRPIERGGPSKIISLRIDQPWMNGSESLLIVLVLCTTLSLLTLRFGLLTRSGAVASFVVGMIIGGLGSIAWLLTLIVFTFMGFLVTKFKFKAKEIQGVQEGKKGERTHKNIIANGLVPVLVVVISFLTGEQNSMLAGVAFLSAISVAAADTTASELGVLSPRTYLITTLERVPPGTDGGSQHMEHYGASSPPFSLQRSAGSSCSRTIF